MWTWGSQFLISVWDRKWFWSSIRNLSSVYCFKKRFLFRVEYTFVILKWKCSRFILIFWFHWHFYFYGGLGMWLRTMLMFRRSSFFGQIKFVLVIFRWLTIGRHTEVRNWFIGYVEWNATIFQSIKYQLVALAKWLSLLMTFIRWWNTCTL